MEKIDINILKLKKASEGLRAVSHKMRLNIIELLIQKGELNVQDIYTSLKTDQSIVSQQLRILKDAEIVINRREGKQIFYSANLNKLAVIKDTVEKFDLISKERIKNKKEALRKELMG